MSNKSYTQSPEFAALKKHYADIKDVHLRDIFKADPKRFNSFHAAIPGLLFDYSKRRINAETLKLLTGMAKAAHVEEWRDKMFAGAKVNVTEDRPALHMALRGSVDKNISIDGENVSNFVTASLKKMKDFCAKTRHDKKFTDIVNIGIGGSDLGARMACEALGPFADGPRIHFLANIDGAAMDALLKKLNHERVLFLVTSKTFTTLETMTNAHTAKNWLESRHQNAENQFIAVTENIEAAKKFGIREENIFPMRPWIGGRYGVWSAAGLPLALSIGFDNFENFLKGAAAMDTHFKSAPLDKNIPVLMAALSIWERNFFGCAANAIIPYAENLWAFPAYLQQLDMESNGKSVDLDGHKVDYETGAVVFGNTGANAQHAFFQALHQGTNIIPCEFILTAKPTHNLPGHHAPLNANALAQSKAFMEGHENKTEPHKNYEGNRPSSTLILDRLYPYHLGLLLALYEHKTFAQAVIWNINSFDQWGVERGKTLSKDITQALENDQKISNFDSSTAGLIQYLRTHS